MATAMTTSIITLGFVAQGSERPPLGAMPLMMVLIPPLSVSAARTM